MKHPLYCCECQQEVLAVRVGGERIYPHRRDLRGRAFYQCPHCANYVGTHARNCRPLGCIPSPELRAARQRLHELIDPLWKNGSMKRPQIYRQISNYLGYRYHSAEIRSLDEASRVERFVRSQYHNNRKPK